jgi:hypothetical protein
MEISISKEVLPTLEGYGLEETVLGERRGSVRQYRNSDGLHVREYEDRFVIHRDSVDPRIDPLGHLLVDSVETPLALGAALFLSQKSRSGSSRGTTHWNPLSFLLAFLSLNRLFKLMKKLL